MGIYTDPKFGITDIEGESEITITVTYDGGCRQATVPLNEEVEPRPSMGSLITKAVASVAVCALGAFSMSLTKGDTGIGWAIIGLIIIW